MGVEEPLSVLVVDGEVGPREELAAVLGRDAHVAQVWRAASTNEALHILERGDVDAVFLDVAMPGLSGLDLARLVGLFKDPPAVVFVTAHDEFAVAAFEVHAVDFLLKPVRAQRVAEALRRIVDGGRHPQPSTDDLTIPVDRAGVTSFVRRSDIQYVESQGDYARLHTSTESHLVRIPITVLQERWRDAGFVRIHRHCLVSLRHVSQLRHDGPHCAVVVDGVELAVSRRHTRELRDVLVRHTGALAGR